MNFVENKRVLSGSALKLIGMASMVIDHVAFIFLYDNAECSTAYELMRMVGRISYPVFAFLLVEGYFHTNDFGRYAMRLLTFAIISEIPWHLINHDGTHNVLFTLLAGLFVLYLIEHWKTKDRDIVLLLIFTSLLLTYYRTDYEWRGLLLILLFYLFRKQRVLQTLSGLLVMSFYGMPGALLAFGVLNTYNGNRGIIHGNHIKYLIYLFYPCHLTVLWLVKAYT